MAQISPTQIDCFQRVFRMKELISKLLNLFRPIYRRAFFRKKIKFHRTAKVFNLDKCIIGKYSYIGPGVLINAQGGVKVGEGTILAPEVTILSSSHDYLSGNLLPYDIYDLNKSVSIGKGVWIGYRALICPGVIIGDGAIIAMGAVVVKNVGRGEIVGGNPARLISKRDVSKIDTILDKNDFLHRRYWGIKRPREVTDKNNDKDY